MLKGAGQSKKNKSPWDIDRELYLDKNVISIAMTHHAANEIV